uniref:Uncharacterized protein n=1 Tax=Mimivirus LCMiAC01 TaxID=2506608 RepID=A0A481YZ80_9VIRU|nr:MAG: uncharacterized protein LCMiAC01_02390 [Mimivirus LCMiAC01]
MINRTKYENFYWSPLHTGPESTDCYKLNKKNCVKYSNCGLCLKNGRLNCLPGDEQGPFFKEDCMGWFHNNHYDRYHIGEKVLRATPPWNMHYPSYETRYPSPVIRSTLL